MIIKNEIRKIPFQGHKRVKVNAGELILGVSPADGSLTLTFKSEKGIMHLLCYHFKRIGNINRYARCYGIEFERKGVKGQ